MIRKLRYLGDPILRKKCRPVGKITDEIRALGQDLLDSMVGHNGSGLAAPQLGYDVRMFAIQVSDTNDEYGYPLDAEPKVFINPKIVYFSKEKEADKEGCLSIPGFMAMVMRPQRIRVEATDLNGNKFTEELENWRSRCVQHECDHLDGILHIDRMSDKLKKKHEHELKVLELHLQKKNTFTGDPFIM